MIAPAERKRAVWMMDFQADARGLAGSCSARSGVGGVGPACHRLAGAGRGHPAASVRFTCLVAWRLLNLTVGTWASGGEWRSWNCVSPCPGTGRRGDPSSVGLRAEDGVSTRFGVPQTASLPRCARMNYNF